MGKQRKKPVSAATNELTGAALTNVLLTALAEILTLPAKVENNKSMVAAKGIARAALARKRITGRMLTQEKLRLIGERHPTAKTIKLDLVTGWIWATVDEEPNGSETIAVGHIFSLEQNLKGRHVGC